MSLLASLSSLPLTRKVEIAGALVVGTYGMGRLFFSEYEGKKMMKKKEEEGGEGTMGEKKENNNNDNNDKNKKKQTQYSELVKRLSSLFKIMFPTYHGREMIHLLALSFCLISRTLISIKVAETTGQIALHLVQANWDQFIKGVVHFSVFVGIPASIINSLLKYETSMLALCFRDRITTHVNNMYVSHTNFYKATNLPQSHIENIDQRVTTDIERFCEDVANLYSSIFKPVLDITLNTIRLSSIMGSRGPLMLVVYYLILGQVKMKLMPNFKKLTEVQSELEGNYRTCHSRLIANSEEISFYDGANRERGIITDIFTKLFNHCASFARQRAVAAVMDQYLIKYGSSVCGYFIMSLPIFFPIDGTRNGEGADAVANHTRDFVRNRQLLMDLASGVGTLLSTTNKIASLAGSTSRVCEVVDAISELDNIGTQPFAIRPEAVLKPASIEVKDDSTDLNDSGLSAVSASTPVVKELNVAASQVGKFDEKDFVASWCLKGEKMRADRDTRAKQSGSTLNPNGPVPQTKLTEGELARKAVVASAGIVEFSDIIEFENATIVSPDGRVLVTDLNLKVYQACNIMITGPNGAGKSSLFRILGDLWPLHSGKLLKPGKEDIMFLPQKPYQVLGSLRDQIIYPHNVDQMSELNVTDEDLCKLLALVDPANSILRQWKLDDSRNWFNAFSGGQKQRVAMARVFYHRPRYAILDECTSAVSEEVEGRMYTLCKQFKITLFTVSHRSSLQVYHDYQLRFDGFGNWEFLSNEEIATRNQQKAIELMKLA